MRTLTRITRREAKKIYKKDPNLITIGFFTKADGGAYWGHLDGESFEQFYQRMKDYLPHRRLVYAVYSGEDTYGTGLTQLLGFDPKLLGLDPKPITTKK